MGFWHRVRYVAACGFRDSVGFIALHGICDWGRFAADDIAGFSVRLGHGDWVRLVASCSYRDICRLRHP